MKSHRQKSRKWEVCDDITFQGSVLEAIRGTSKPRFAGIDGTDCKFLLTFGSADSRIRLRMESEPLVVRTLDFGPLTFLSIELIAATN